MLVMGGRDHTVPEAITRVQLMRSWDMRKGGDRHGASDAVTDLEEFPEDHGGDL